MKLNNRGPAKLSEPSGNRARRRLTAIFVTGFPRMAWYCPLRLTQSLDQALSTQLFRTGARSAKGANRQPNPPCFPPRDGDPKVTSGPTRRRRLEQSG